MDQLIDVSTTGPVGLRAALLAEEWQPVVVEDLLRGSPFALMIGSGD